MRLLALFMALFASAACADPTTYRIDNAKTHGEFEIGHFGVMHTLGRFTELGGRLAVDQAAKAGSIVLDIVAASVATDIDSRDEFIRGESMFDVARYPRINFSSTRFEFAGEKLVRVAGDLTLRGVKRPIVLDARGMDCGGTSCSVEVNGTIRRRDFGMTALWPLLSDDVELRFRIYGVKD